MEEFGVIIVGAGQAGIAMGYYAKQIGFSFILLDGNEKIGDSWRQRYDSLELFTPRKYSSLPGLEMTGSPDGFPSKDEMADYLEQYVAYFSLPVRLNTYIKCVKKNEGMFEIETNQGMVRAFQVIIASGAFQRSFIPPVTQDKEGGPFQIHSSEYLSPKQIKKGSVLVVGGGNSGAQIAVELADERNVTMAVSHPFKFLPLRFLGKSIFYWLDLIGLLYAGINTKRGEWFKGKSDPVFGHELKRIIANRKISIKPRVIKVEKDKVLFEDQSVHSFDNIIWATGFIPAYEWIHIDGAISSNGNPVHERGISPIKGLYFIGLPWQHQRGSALICGVGYDARYLVPYITKY